MTVIVSLTLWAGYATIRINEKPVEYTFDVHTDDLDLRDVALVQFGGNLYYGQHSYLFAESSSEQNFKEASVRMTVDGKEVLSTASSDPFLHSSGGGHTFQSDSHDIPGGTLHENLRVTKRSKVKVEIAYKVDGRSESFSSEFSLSGYRTPFSSTGPQVVVLNKESES